MNATFGKVLREVLTGLLIMESNMKKSRIKRFLKTKRVMRQSGFVLGCHVQTIREREREREREGERERSTINGEYQKRKWKSTYAWTMHEHVMCKENGIIGSTQSNPTSTQVSTYKHTYIMHETLWKCKCNAMHEHITPNKQNSTQKFHKILKDFQKSQKFKKTQNLDLNAWNAWRMRD